MTKRMASRCLERHYKVRRPARERGDVWSCSGRPRGLPRSWYGRGGVVAAVARSHSEVRRTMLPLRSPFTPALE